MQCPKCDATTSVVDSRPQISAIKRRRRCDDKLCGHRFNTQEIILHDLPKTTPTPKPKPKKRKLKPRDPFKDPAYLESLNDEELEALIGGGNG